MKGYKELGNKYLKQKKKHAALVMTSIALSTMVLYIILSFFIGLMKNTIKCVEEQGDYCAVFYKVDADMMDKINNHVGIDHVDYARTTVKWSYQDYYGDSFLELICVEKPEQDTFGYEIVDGSFPKNTSEIMIWKDSVHLFKNVPTVGDKITLEAMSSNGEIHEKTYTVSGIFERKYQNEFASVSTAFILASEGTTFDAYIRFNKFKSWKEQFDNIVSDLGIDEEQADINETLAGNYGQDENTMASVAMILMVLVFVVYICMVMVRSLFTSNLMEKIKDFSVIKAIGGTDKQLRKIFSREIYISGIIAFLIGVVVSHIVMFIFENSLDLFGFEFEFSIISFLGAFLFVIITISLAIIEPFNILKKTSLVEGINANYALTNSKKIKKRKGKLFRIFGIEGEYAYKNMRRNSKGFSNAIASFTISVLLMTTLVTVITNAKSMFSFTESGATIEYPFDITANLYSNEISASDLDEKKKIFMSEDFVTEVVNKYGYFYGDPREDGDFSNFSDAVYVQIYTEEQLKTLENKMNDDIDPVEALKNGGIILVNEYTQYWGETTNTINPFEYKKGDTVKVLDPRFMFSKKAKDAGVVTAGLLKENENALIDMEIKGTCTALDDMTTITQVIMSYDYLASVCSEDNLAILCEGFLINVDEASFDKEIFDSLAFDKARVNEWNYMDPMRIMNDEMKFMKNIVIFIIAFIIIIGIVNVLHSMISEQQERCKEIAILRSIGMSKKKLNKMLMLEKVIIGLIAWFIGTVLGAVFTRTIVTVTLYLEGRAFVIPWVSYILIGVGMVVLMLILSLIMISSSGKLNIINSIRNND